MKMTVGKMIVFQMIVVQTTVVQTTAVQTTESQMKVVKTTVVNLSDNKKCLRSSIGAFKGASKTRLAQHRCTQNWFTV